MSWSDIGNLSLIWWNTSLVPPVPGDEPASTDVDFAVTQIQQMRRELGFAVLGLAEVDTKVLEKIISSLADSELDLIDATGQVGGLINDTAFIYDRRKLRLNTWSRVTSSYGKQTLKIGLHATFVTVDTGENLHIVASHWKSRMTASEHESVRHLYGSTLRGVVNRLRQDDQDVRVVLMGDYNDDPSSPSLAEQLLATRDRRLAKKSSEHLYNPFWRWMGESEHAEHVDGRNSICGTIHYPAGNFTEWHTFDQMIFSNALLSAHLPNLMSD